MDPVTAKIQNDWREFQDADDFIQFRLLCGSETFSDGFQGETMYTVFQRRRISVSEIIQPWLILGKERMREIAVEKLRQQTRVWVTCSNTINLKDFNSAKLEAGMSIDVQDNQTPEEAFDNVWNIVGGQIREARGAVLRRVLKPKGSDE